MPSTAPPSDERTPMVDLAEMRAQDAYWARRFWQERSWRHDLGYEDYAPAYCVGYVGYAQYGGEFAEAERSLCANWVRIKGDSQLAWEEAEPAIRAAWDRMAMLGQRRRPAVNDPRFGAAAGPDAPREADLAVAAA